MQSEITSQFSLTVLSHSPVLEACPAHPMSHSDQSIVYRLAHGHQPQPHAEERWVTGHMLDTLAYPPSRYAQRKWKIQDLSQPTNDSRFIRLTLCHCPALEAVTVFPPPDRDAAILDALPGWAFPFIWAEDPEDPEDPDESYLIACVEGKLHTLTAAPALALWIRQTMHNYRQSLPLEKRHQHYSTAPIITLTIEYSSESRSFTEHDTWSGYPRHQPHVCEVCRS